MKKEDSIVTQHLGDLVHGTKKTNVLRLQNWLYKRSPSIAKAWQRRWFVLSGDVITYYKKSEPVGELILQYHTLVSELTIQKNNKVYFNITTPDRKFELRCDDESIARKWVTECISIVQSKKETTVSLNSALPEPTPNFSPSFFASTDGEDGTEGEEEPVPAPKGTLRGNKVEKMLGLALEQQTAGDDKTDKDFEYKYRANIRYMMEKYRSSMSRSVSLRAPNTLGGDGVYRILSLDGGGLRGIMHAVLLERLCKKFPTLLDNVDMIAGTSGGAIIAASLASNYPPAFARRVFELGASLVFNKKTMKTMSNAKYTSKWLKTTVEEIASDKKLNDLPRKLVVPAFQLDSYNPFHPEGVRRWGASVAHNVGRDSHGSVPVVDAILRTIAAPTYFPSYQGYIDGGVFAHNPTMAAVSLALSTQYEGMTPDKVVVLSLGTGRVARHLPTDNGEEYDWGLMQWAPKITDLMLDASCTATNLLAENLLGPRYHRVDPWYKTDVAMDDPGLMPALSTLANELDVSATLQWIADVFMPKNYSARSNSFVPAVAPAMRATISVATPSSTPVIPIHVLAPPAGKLSSSSDAIVAPTATPTIPDATPTSTPDATPTTAPDTTSTISDTTTTPTPVVDTPATPPLTVDIPTATPALAVDIPPTATTTPTTSSTPTSPTTASIPEHLANISRQTRVGSAAEDTVHDLSSLRISAKSSLHLNKIKQQSSLRINKTVPPPPPPPEEESEESEESESEESIESESSGAEDDKEQRYELKIRRQQEELASVHISAGPPSDWI